MMLFKNSVLLYYSEQDVFSSMFPVEFRIKNLTFHCQEQFIMYCKALFFKEWSLAKDIMVATNGYNCKRLGKKVNQSPEYSHSAWVAKRPYYAMVSTHAKYEQNPLLQSVLLSTGSSVLGEASPTDFDWGIGLSKADEGAFDSTKWKGQNLHGVLNMQYRDALFLQNKITPVLNIGQFPNYIQKVD